MIEAQISVKAISEPQIINEVAKEIPNKLCSNAINATKNEIPASSIEKAAESNLKDPETIAKLKNALTDDSSTQIKTINEGLADRNHPETGVPFKEKTIENSEGKLVTGVFPDFGDYTKFETNLPEEYHNETDYQQFKRCNEDLKKAYENGDLNTENFSERQIEQIKNGDKPEDLTWHHCEEKGKMQLVATEVHEKTSHTGGKEVWGGGAEFR